jgi:hypothetical protein
MAVVASVSTLPGALNLYFRPADEFILNLSFFQPDKITPIDVSGFTKVATIYSKTTGYTDTFTVTDDPVETNKIQLILDIAQTKALDIYTSLNWFLKFDAKITVVAGTVYPMEDQ